MPDPSGFLVAGSHGGGNIAAASLNLDLHVKFAARGDVGNHMIRIDDLDIMPDFDIAGRYNAFTLF